MKIINALQAMVARRETDEVLITGIVNKVNAFLPEEGKISLTPTPTPESVISALNALDNPLRSIVESLPAENHKELDADGPKAGEHPVHLQRPPWTKNLFTVHLFIGLIGVFFVTVSLITTTASFSPELKEALYSWLYGLLQHP